MSMANYTNNNIRTEGSNALSPSISTNAGKILSFPTSTNNSNLKLLKPTSKSNHIGSLNHKKGESTKVYPLSNEEVARISNYLLNIKHNLRDYTLFIFGINTGLRCGDIIKLKWDHIINKHTGDIDTFIQVLEEKTENTRSQKEYRNIEFNPIVIDVLRDFYLGEYYRTNTTPTGYVFKSQRQSHIEVDTVRKMLKEAAEECGVTVNIGSHTMRKTFGRRFMEIEEAEGRYNSILILQEIFGHSSVKITMKYIGMNKIMEREIYNKIMLK